MKSITMQYLSDTTQKVNLGTTTSEERCPQARSREMCRAAYPNTAFTGTASQTKSFCLRHPLICCRLFLCTKRIGMNTAMRHPVPFRTGCFFNASRIIQTSNIDGYEDTNVAVIYHDDAHIIIVEGGDVDLITEVGNQ